jgi:uncharacterized membrane protein
MTLTVRFMLVFLVLLFGAAGLAHFTHADMFLKVMPDYLPAHLLLIHISGVCELIIATGLCIRGLRQYAAYGAIALLIAVFPAHIQSVLHPEAVDHVPVWVLWARMPFQLVFGYFAWCVAHAGKTKSEFRS